jgi:hypothetical protein
MAMTETSGTSMRIGIILVMLLGMLGCDWERNTHVRIEGVPPRFTMTGSGTLGQFTVFGLGGAILWEIQPENWHTFLPVETLRVIEFGVVPNGCKQIVPETGSRPAPLVPDEPYTFQIVTGDAPGVGGMFEVVDGKTVFTEKTV